MFADGQCKIHDKVENIIVSIPKTQGLYYTVSTVEEELCIATDPHHPVTLSVMELHHHMDHIALKAACCLVSEGHVSDIHLEPGNDSTYYKSCV